MLSPHSDVPEHRKRGDDLDLFIGFRRPSGTVLRGEYLVRGDRSIARTYRISPMVIGLVIVGFGISAKELLVSAQAALLGGLPRSAGAPCWRPVAAIWPR
jgi:hypothetical protein